MTTWCGRSHDNNKRPFHSKEAAYAEPLFVRKTGPSSGLGDFTGADTGGTHAQSLPSSIYHRMNTTEIRVPPAPGDIVRMANVISVGGPFTANFTLTRH